MNLYVSTSTDTTLSLAWTYPTGWTNGGSSVTAWNVYAVGNPASGTPVFPAETNPTAVTSDGNTLYYNNFDCTNIGTGPGNTDFTRAYIFFKVSAVTAVGPGILSNSRRFRCSQAPAAPSGATTTENAPTLIATTRSSVTIE